jgi:hypothetical protein
MTIPCTKSAQTDGEHRLDFKEDIGGMSVWYCLDCGETITQYSDSQGG